MKKLLIMVCAFFLLMGCSKEKPRHAKCTSRQEQSIMSVEMEFNEEYYLDTLVWIWESTENSEYRANKNVEEIEQIKKDLGISNIQDVTASAKGKVFKVVARPTLEELKHSSMFKDMPIDKTSDVIVKDFQNSSNVNVKCEY